MADYRLYFHDSGGHFLRAQNIDVADDAAALEAASQIDHAHSIEVWCGKRKVGIVKPGG